MLLLARGLAALSLAAPCLARAVPHQLQPRQDGQPTHICGDIVDAANQGYSTFLASDAYKCLTSVPFNPAVGTRFIHYWNETLQFQSTLAYLKNPPQGYQQPAVDVVAQMNRIQQNINAGVYQNQYDFEVDVQLVVYAMHDGHVSLSAGVLSAFSFASPIEIVSVSVDGKQAPKVYITDDILESPKEGWTPSAITTINGTEVNSFLTSFGALNSWGYLEPNAEWNSLMSNPTLDIQGGLTSFSGYGDFYPGDNLTFTFENGSSYDTIWIAYYDELANYTGPLATGGDFYNYFVLGLLPASFDASALDTPVSNDTDNSTTSSQPVTNWNNASYGAFPTNPVIVQADLGILTSGVVTGYFLDDISTGVLSLPTFSIDPDATGNYTDTVSYFVGNASEKGLQRIIIDLQQNSGGEIFLAYTIFKIFFPDLTPFGGSRRRSFDLGNVLGSSISDYWALLDENNDDDRPLKGTLAADEWVIEDRLNAATNRNFTNWAEYQGPINDNGDSFSLIERFDLANIFFDEAAFDQWIPLMYLANATGRTDMQRSFNPDQIVLLTDGLCSSACALFAEFMTQAGVRTLVAGGRPSQGPMQAVAGTRGAVSYDASDLDNDFSFARSIDTYVPENVNATIPEVRDNGMFYSYATINLRDQIRQNEVVPLQFKYLAADCRIYYTLKNIYNTTQLWHDTYNAAFVDSSLCVAGSTGYSSTNNTNPTAPPKPSAQPLSLNQKSESPTFQVKWDDDSNQELLGPRARSLGGGGIQACPASGNCPDPQTVCHDISVTCPGGGGQKSVKACLPRCTNHEQQSGCSCSYTQQGENKVVFGATTQASESTFVGVCIPTIGSTKLGCAKDPVAAS